LPSILAMHEFNISSSVRSCIYMSVKTIKIKLNDNMDRLFGTELSNLLEPHLYCKPRQIGRVHSQSTRVVS